MLIPAIEDVRILRVKHGDGGLGEGDGAVGITNRTNADKVVREYWEDVAFGGSCGEFW